MAPFLPRFSRPTFTYFTLFLFLLFQIHDFLSFPFLSFSLSLSVLILLTFRCRFEKIPTSFYKCDVTTISVISEHVCCYSNHKWTTHSSFFFSICVTSSPKYSVLWKLSQGHSHYFHNFMLATHSQRQIPCYHHSKVTKLIS